MNLGAKLIMKSKWNLISSIVQLEIGILAIIAFVVLLVSGENMTKWIMTLLLAIAFVIVGAIGIVDYVKQKQQSEKETAASQGKN